jgi:hypothetical protein
MNQCALSTGRLAKVVILALIKLNRIKSVHVDGATIYHIL